MFSIILNRVKTLSAAFERPWTLYGVGGPWNQKILLLIKIKLINQVLLKGYALANVDVVSMKGGEELISFILEDFVEVGLQYFYFEKYSFLPNDILVYFNASFMVLKALELTIRMIIVMKEDWTDDDEESFW